MSGKLSRLPADFRDRRILVLGDVMLDRYVYGRVNRLSPEAPVPVLEIERETVMPGGAANVAANIASLGGHAILIGRIGDDMAGSILHGMLRANPAISADDLLVVSSHITTQKVRYIAERQQMMRADSEDKSPAAAEPLLAAFHRNLPGVDVVVLSDYAKGVLTDAVLKEVIAASRAAGKTVLADPKSPDLARYDGVTVLTPNRGEAARAAGIAGEGDHDTAQAAAAILASLPDTGAILVTRGPHGMTLAARGREPTHVKAVTREVFDVSGAGDTVLATLALSLAAGHDLAVAAHLANSAAGIVVSKAGTASVLPGELSAGLQNEQIETAEAKIADLDVALARIARWRASGARIGFTNGCFDLIHPGHISLLSQARAKCDRLIVGLNSDSSVRGLKGAGRPIQDETARAIVLASLGMVDQVILFDAETPQELIAAIRPDLLVKGADYTMAQVVGADIVQAHGGEVLLVDLTPGQSTTATISRLVRTGS